MSKRYACGLETIVKIRSNFVTGLALTIIGSILTPLIIVYIYEGGPPSRIEANQKADLVRQKMYSIESFVKLRT